MPALTLAAGPPAPDGLVPAVVDPASPDTGGGGVSLLLTHGAGGDLAGPPLAALARGVAAGGHTVVRFTMAYRHAGRASPPLAEKSVPGYRAAFEDAQRQLGGGRWAAGGKSYGGRVASLAVAAGMPVAGLVFYGYPLHAPGKPDALRVDHWPSITVPCLFLQGSQDPFCTLDLLRSHLPELGGPATLHVVDGGDHSLQVRAKDAPDGKAHAAPEVLAGLGALVARWLDGL